jgi:hypothetical protein
MQFAIQWLRNTTGTGLPALGTDADPTTAYGTPGSPPGSYVKNTINRDNVLLMRHYSKAGIPYRRVAILATGPTSPDAARTASLYFWEALTQHWYLIGAKSSVSLTYNSLTLVTIPTIGEAVASATTVGTQSMPSALQPQPRNPGTALQGDPGGLALMLNVDSNGTPTAGTYQFSMAPSFSADVT